MTTIHEYAKILLVYHLTKEMLLWLKENIIIGVSIVMLKQHGVIHGCECLEAGILVDFFTPMREDFIK